MYARIMYAWERGRPARMLEQHMAAVLSLYLCHSRGAAEEITRCDRQAAPSAEIGDCENSLYECPL